MIEDVHSRGRRLDPRDAAADFDLALRELR
jgi:hypothetical protein